MVGTRDIQTVQMDVAGERVMMEETHTGHMYAGITLAVFRRSVCKR